MTNSKKEPESDSRTSTLIEIEILNKKIQKHIEKINDLYATILAVMVIPLLTDFIIKNVYYTFFLQPLEDNSNTKDYLRNQLSQPIKDYIGSANKKYDELIDFMKLVFKQKTDKELSPETMANILKDASNSNMVVQMKTAMVTIHNLCTIEVKKRLDDNINKIFQYNFKEIFDRMENARKFCMKDLETEAIKMANKKVLKLFPINDYMLVAKVLATFSGKKIIASFLLKLFPNGVFQSPRPIFLEDLHIAKEKNIKNYRDKLKEHEEYLYKNTPYSILSLLIQGIFFSFMMCIYISQEEISSPVITLSCILAALFGELSSIGWEYFYGSYESSITQQGKWMELIFSNNDFSDKVFKEIIEDENSKSLDSSIILLKFADKSSLNNIVKTSFSYHGIDILHSRKNIIRISAENFLDSKKVINIKKMIDESFSRIKALKEVKKGIKEISKEFPILNLIYKRALDQNDLPLGEIEFVFPSIKGEEFFKKLTRLFTGNQVIKFKGNENVVFNIKGYPLNSNSELANLQKLFKEHLPKEDKVENFLKDTYQPSFFNIGQGEVPSKNFQPKEQEKDVNSKQEIFSETKTESKTLRKIEWRNSVYDPNQPINNKMRPVIQETEVSEKSAQRIRYFLQNGLDPQLCQLNGTIKIYNKVNQYIDSNPNTMDGSMVFSASSQRDQKNKQFISQFSIRFFGEGYVGTACAVGTIEKNDEGKMLCTVKGIGWR